MPATFTRHPVEIERKDTGIGGKPPLDRRPTGGGGDGDNWENRPSGRRGPRELLGRYRLGVLFALVLLFDPGLGGVVEQIERQLGHALEHGQKPSFDLPPERLSGPTRPRPPVR